MQDEYKRMQIQKMVKDELEKWDEPLSAMGNSGGYASRAASPPGYTPSKLDVGKKNAWRQQ